MADWWQHLPETLDPIAFTIGFFSVYWYAIWFLAGFFAVFFLALRRVRKGEGLRSEEAMVDMFLYIFFGAVLGGRIGYVLFYNPDVFLAAPYAVFLPYDFTRGVWIGIAGMSYHGGLLGAILALYWFTRKKRISRRQERPTFWQAADFAALLMPIATAFGRLGNFFNGELYGRITERPWGMVFPGVDPAGVLRHPSALYEAFFEGVVLFLCLLFFRKKMPFSGALACTYLAGYAVLRFIGEFFRSPDPQLGFFFGIFTMGQLLSCAMLASASLIFLWLQHRNRVTIAPST